MKPPCSSGLSVVPYVYYKEPPEGPHAGEFLQPLQAASRRAASLVTGATLAADPASPLGQTSEGPRRMKRETLHVTRNASSLAQEPSHEQRGRSPDRSQPPGDQPLDRRRRRGRAHLHGGARHHDRQRRAALHRRRPVGANIDSEWVLTSYLAANATILPISGWLSAHLGRRNYFLLSIAVFTIASGLCGMATSLEQLILFRVIQGLAGGGLQPSSQGILLDSFPPEKQGAAMTMFAIAGLLAPVVGPTLGGYLTVNYDWRWIFYINIPVGALGFLASYLVVRDPEYLTNERAELRRQPLNFDYIGLGLLVLVMSSWEIMLSKGQEWDWYNDPFWRVQTLFVLLRTSASAVLVFRELRIAQSGRRLPAARRAQLRRARASSSSVPTPSSTAPARRSRACCNPSSATTPMSRDWSSRPQASSRS